MTEESKPDPKPNRLAELLKHPLANVLIGFLLTGVVGSALTQHFIAQRSMQQMQAELSNVRKASIAKLSALNAEYLARAEMLFNAVERGDEDAAAELKGAYREAALRWRSESSPALMAAREVLPAEVYPKFRDRLRSELHDRFLVPLGACLETARARMAEGSDVTAVLEQCRARDTIQRAAACSQSLLDTLYELSGLVVDGELEQALRQNREVYLGRLEAACAALE